MRVLAGWILLTVAGPALACQCIALKTPEQKREMAAQIAAKAIAVVDVEQIAPIKNDAKRGEIYRVVAVHVGRAPARFELYRWFDGHQPVMMSCDVAPPPGQRATVALYAGNSPGRLSMGWTCDQSFVNSPGDIDLIRAEKRKLAGATAKR